MTPSIALSDPNWRVAMYDAYNALVKNNTWILVGIDCDDTFSLVVKPATIQTIHGLTLSRKWPIQQLDVKNAFLNIDISKIIYMHLVLGFNDFLVMFYALGSLLVDVILLCMFMSQKKYTLELLDKAHMANCNPTRTPIDTRSKLDSNGDPISDPTLYRSLAGGLQYLIFTRLYISYTVQQPRRKKTRKEEEIMKIITFKEFPTSEGLISSLEAHYSPRTSISSRYNLYGSTKLKGKQWRRRDQQKRDFTFWRDALAARLEEQPQRLAEANEPPSSWMDTLRKVSEYLNNLEAFLNDGDSLEARKIMVEKSEKELEIKPFMRFSMPCGVHGQGAWDAELDMADSQKYMPEQMFDKLGFVRVIYGDYRRKMVIEVFIDMGHGTMSIDDGVIRHTYFLKPRAKAYLKNFEINEEGYGMYLKIEGDWAWHAKFEVIILSGRKFTRGFKKRKLRGSSLEISLRRTCWKQEKYQSLPSCNSLSP
ncbi:ribonuclease H-like domain-containing protein [Tanacetum coccineum]